MTNFTLGLYRFGGEPQGAPTLRFRLSSHLENKEKEKNIMSSGLHLFKLKNCGFLGGGVVGVLCMVSHLRY